MATVIKAPTPVPYNLRHMESIFLVGSIDMGVAVNWQERVEQELANFDVVICNPRRDDWDSSWVQDISNDKFREQVEWELDHIEGADFVIVYFDPNGPAPITLLELGTISQFRYAGDKVVVCCPEGYWRRGNVQIVCDRYGIPLYETLDDAITALKLRLHSG